jgi:hypothetical protein
MRALISLLWLVVVAVAAEAPGPLARTAQGATAPAQRLTFVQTKHLAILDQPLVSPGVIEIDRRHGRLRWEFTGQAVLILADGRLRRWGADGQEEDLDANPSSAALIDQFQALLSGSWATLDELFAISESPDGTTILLTARSPDLARHVSALTVVVDEAGLPRSLTLDAAGGDRTEYAFTPGDPAWQPDPARFRGP